MKKPRERKVKIPGNENIPGNVKFPMKGKIPRDEKPRGFLVMGETNCPTLKNPCFIKE